MPREKEDVVRDKLIRSLSRLPPFLAGRFFGRVESMKGKVFIGFIGVLFLVLAGTLSYFYAYYYLHRGWNVYRNEVFGFEIKYPPSWEVWQKPAGTTRIQPALDTTMLEVGAPMEKQTYPQTGVLSFIVNQNGYDEMVRLMDSYLTSDWLLSKKQVSIQGTKVPQYETETEIETNARQTYVPIQKYTLVVAENAGVTLTGQRFSSLHERLVIDSIIRSITVFEPQSFSVWNPSCTVPELSQIEVSVERGEGMTHIARKAVQQYTTFADLKELPRKPLYLLPEEKVFAEDYLVKHLESRSTLYEGNKIIISCSLVEEATMRARALTIEQRENLGSYGGGVTEFQQSKELQDIINEATGGNGLTPIIIQP